VEKQKDAEFKGILSRVTTGGRYKPNWVWQKTNGACASVTESKSSVVEKGEDAASPPDAPESEIPKKKKKIVFQKKKTLKNKSNE
jgi:hypothetical protein